MTRAMLVFLLFLFAATAAAQEKKEPAADGKKPEATKPDTKPDPTARFWEARRVMLAGKPKDAAELFRTIVAEAPAAEVADDCLYWAGRCWLRIDDREPDAVVAFKRLVTSMPMSPFVDDAARELARLGDRTLVPELAKRLDGKGPAVELAARALAELGDSRGVAWLAEKRGEKKKEPAAAAAPERKETREAPKKSKDREIEELRAEVKRLRRELDETVKLVEQLLTEKDEAQDPESETKK